MYFWPTRFKREVDNSDDQKGDSRLNERTRYMLKMLPWLVLINLSSYLALGVICDQLGIVYRWTGSWMWIGIVVGITAGLACGVMGNVFVGVVFGALFSTAGGVPVGSYFGVVYGLTLGTAFSMFYFAVGGARGGLTLGIMYGVVGGALNGPVGGVVGCVMLWSAYFRVFTYPFNVALSVTAYAYGKVSPHAIKTAWRLCPITWNEVIWLPLPFAADLLIALTRQEREEGFRQIAFIAAERRLQKAVASHASEEIALYDLKATSTKEIANVADTLDWTTDSPSDLPHVLVAAFPRFEKIAQHVDQYLQLNNIHRKRDALNRAVAESEGLQKSLIAVGNHLAARLLQRANEWRALLEAEHKNFITGSMTPIEIPNPFVYGKGLVETEHNVFTGRQEIVQQIEASILGAMQVPTLLLHGPRRMGKSSIVNQLPRLLGPEFAPSVVDCQDPAIVESVATLLHYLSRELSKGLRRRHVIVQPLPITALRREPYTVFNEWLDHIATRMPQRMRVLLCLDEYERLQSTLDAGWGHALLDALRHILQHRPEIVLLFTGAHTFQELGEAWTDRFMSTRRVRVSFLTREEVFPLLTKPIPEFNMTYAPGALDTVFAATNGQPNLTQAIAFELVQLLNEQHRKEATPEDVEIALSCALVNGAEYFVGLWNDAGVEGQAILRAISRGDAPPDAPAAEAWLREHDVLGTDGDFAVKMVKRWVENNS